MRTKLRFLNLSIVFCFFYSLQAFAGTDQSIFENEKIEHIAANENGVFLLVNGNWISAQGIVASADGLLLLREGEWIGLSDVIARDNYYIWQCRSCKSWNVEGTTVCSNCKKPRGS
jgi:hypothetical protein